MEREKEKIKNFTDLYAWQEARVLVKLVYEVTKKFPRDELFGLSSQMRRAAVSIMSNIAEGFGRSTVRDKCQFYTIAQGSVAELQSQLFIAYDVEYISEEELERIQNQSRVANKLVQGLKNIQKS